MKALHEQLESTDIKDALYDAKMANLYYIEWVNDFLTVERFAEYYGVSASYALAVIELGRQYNYGRV